MNKNNNTSFNEEFMSSRSARSQENPYGIDNDFEGFASKKDKFIDSLQRYWGNCKMMMATSFSHLRNPSTLIVIFLLIATYILLGVAGNVEFSFYSKNVVQYINTNLDIIVNALLGYFYGPITCAIGVTLCCIVRIITNRSIFFTFLSLR